MINSDAILYEVNKIPDFERRNQVFLLASKAKVYIQVDNKLIERAKEIQTMGIRTYDALHVASAETAKADVFLTTDDNLLKKLKRFSNELEIRIENPLVWIKEVL